MPARSGETQMPMMAAAGGFVLTLVVGFMIGLYAGEEKPVAKKPQSTLLAKYEKPKPTTAPQPIPEATKPEPTKAKPTEPKPEPTKPEPTKPEPTKPEPTKPEPTKPQPTKPDPKPEPPPPPVEMVSYQEKILPIFKAKCNVCHGDPKIEGELDLRSLLAIKKSPNPLIIAPGKPDDSEIYTRVKDKSMPPGKAEKLTDAELKLVLDWVKSGGK